MGLASSCAGAGIGFATYEALTVAYRKRMGYAPTPSERGAIAGADLSLLLLLPLNPPPTLGLYWEVLVIWQQNSNSPQGCHRWPWAWKVSVPC